MNASRFLSILQLGLLLFLPACTNNPQSRPAAVTPVRSTATMQVTTTPQPATATEQPTATATEKVTATPQPATAGETDRLQRGINLSGWYWKGPQDSAQIDLRFVDKDFALIHELGFTFVRLPIDLSSVMDATRPDLLNADKLAHLDQALDRILSHGLAVIVDLHDVSIQAFGPTIYSGNLETDPNLQETFIRFWNSFAYHLSGRDPRMVYLELMNEPVFEDHPEDWLLFQQRLLEAVRQGAPRLTLIATSARFSSLETFVQMVPVADPNVIYNFHFYDPFQFTHQGASWVSDEVRSLSNVPYPSSPEAIQTVIDSISDPKIKADLMDYGKQRWDAAKIEQTLQQAADWGKRYHVRIICDEFGAYKLNTQPEERRAWMDDTRTAFEKFDIGWSMWAYDGSFGLVERSEDFSPSPTIQVDNPLAQSLGLPENIIQSIEGSQ